MQVIQRLEGVSREVEGLLGASGLRWEGLKQVGGQDTQHILQGLKRNSLTFRMFESISF